jgi:hypothetical protein
MMLSFVREALPACVLLYPTLIGLFKSLTHTPVYAHFFGGHGLFFNPFGFRRLRRGLANGEAARRGILSKNVQAKRRCTEMYRCAAALTYPK